MLNIIISGCNGAMGRTLDSLISKSEDMQIVAGVDLNKDAYNNSYNVYASISEVKEKADVVIDFSKPESLKALLKFGVETKTPLVVATTGLNEEEVASITEASEKVAIFYTANMSLGINLLIELVKKAAAVLSENFDIEIIEKHHNKKVDAPSGTAYMIADEINESLNNSMMYNYGREGKNEKRTKNEIGIHAVRGGTIPGDHTVIFAGNDEIIEVKHSAISKNVFAEGALKGAKFIAEKEKGLFSMKNLIKLEQI